MPASDERTEILEDIFHPCEHSCFTVRTLVSYIHAVLSYCLFRMAYQILEVVLCTDHSNI